MSDDGWIAPDETLPLGQTLVGPAACGSNVWRNGADAAADVGLDPNPNLAILVSGIGTLLFFVITGERLGA